MAAITVPGIKNRNGPPGTGTVMQVHVYLFMNSMENAVLSECVHYGKARKTARRSKSHMPLDL